VGVGGGVSVAVGVGSLVSPGLVGSGVDVGDGGGVDVGGKVGVEVGFGVGVGGGGTGVFVGRISMTSVSVGVAFTSGVKVAAGVPSPCATVVGVGLSLGVEVIAAELQATIKSSKINN
jgi:hypothetical protein